MKREPTPLQQNHFNLFGYPPRAPCWQDFYPSKPNTGRKGLQYKSKPTAKGSQNVSSGSGVIVEAKKKSKKATVSGTSPSSTHHKGTKSRLWRTRSEPNICDTDLPTSSEEVTLNLGDVVLPRHDYSSMDEHVYLKENYKRCQMWLASVEPCCPSDGTFDHSEASQGDRKGSNDEQKMHETMKKSSKKEGKKMRSNAAESCSQQQQQQQGSGGKEKWSWNKKGKKLWRWSANSS